jgi:glycosyltransferase involved in cell wall biosynthesis
MQNFDVCFVCLSLKPGGGNRVIFELSERMAKKSYKCRFLSLTSNSNQNFSKVANLNSDQILCFLKSDSKIAIILNLLLTFLYLIFNKNKYKMIVINNPLIAPIFGLLNFDNLYYYIQADDYRIFDDRFLIKNGFLLWLYKQTTEKVTYKIYGDRYLFNSRFSFDKYKDLSGNNISNPHFILPGIDLSIFSPFQRNDITLKVDELKPITVSTILRKHPWKGSQDFLNAVTTICDQGYGGKFNFVAITNEDVSSLSLPQQVKLLHPDNDQELSLNLNQSDIFVVTSWWEGFGLPGLEAMACGCAIITTKNGGCNEYAKAELNCLMYDPKDVESLVNLIIKLEENHALRKKISECAITTSLNHSWDFSASKLLQLVEAQDNNF